ncbi:UNKNOWN [Stylonychia lemnae]|uniref:Uncharacterized protein n=1 Tax=Stylonychia lemnae TaxID=5949 RepID=A0A078B1L1_STYLE|nr:UNKNOWN [Stylonychia lemnae]|eukprot:CDW87217.1 UNKNOWN [Stylonychia lemnae]
MARVEGSSGQASNLQPYLSKKKYIKMLLDKQNIQNKLLNEQKNKSRRVNIGSASVGQDSMIFNISQQNSAHKPPLPQIREQKLQSISINTSSSSKTIQPSQHKKNKLSNNLIQRILDKKETSTSSPDIFNNSKIKVKFNFSKELSGILTANNSQTPTVLSKKVIKLIKANSDGRSPVNSSSRAINFGSIIQKEPTTSMRIQKEIAQPNYHQDIDRFIQTYDDRLKKEYASFVETFDLSGDKNMGFGYSFQNPTTSNQIIVQDDENEIGMFDRISQQDDNFHEVENEEDEDIMPIFLKLEKMQQQNNQRNSPLKQTIKNYSHQRVNTSTSLRIDDQSFIRSNTRILRANLDRQGSPIQEDGKSFIDQSDGDIKRTLKSINFENVESQISKRQTISNNHISDDEGHYTEEEKDLVFEDDNMFASSAYGGSSYYRPSSVYTRTLSPDNKQLQQNLNLVKQTSILTNNNFKMKPQFVKSYTNKVKLNNRMFQAMETSSAISIDQQNMESAVDDQSVKDRSISSLFPAINQKSPSIIERIKQNNIMRKFSDGISSNRQINIQQLLKRKQDSISLNNNSNMQ